jgi:tRNA A-37 threonylcarbamoyl transferase component Bud32
MNYSHKRDILHRDLKPENILFKTNNLDSPIKIVDFGIAAILCDTQNYCKTTIVGTVLYFNFMIIYSFSKKNEFLLNKFINNFRKFTCPQKILI